MELVVESLNHNFGATTVLENIELTARETEILVVIGPSGCGKSTLLSIMGGLLKPTSGMVSTRGSVPKGCLNPITYVFQDFALLPWRTVSGNVDLALERSGLPAAERRERIADVLARTNLSDFADAFPKQLSGGMRQRCGLARALVVQPAIMLMDEPLSALDAQTRELLMDDFIDLWAREKTTGVYITHNLDEATRLADRVIILSRRPGKIKEIVEIPYPRADRLRPDVAGELATIHSRLWGLLRQDAAVADREVVDV